MKKLNMFILSFCFLFIGCADMPEGITPVQNFETEKYLGTWYEIARLDHTFERGLSNVTATYSLKEDGKVKVLNKGFNVEDNEWSDAEGKAYFAENETVGFLKVSFFGPFYGSYVVFELDEEYQYAFVSGNTTDYLWFLARSPEVSEKTKQHFIAKAKEKGFDTNQLIFVDHSAK